MKKTVLLLVVLLASHLSAATVSVDENASFGIFELEGQKYIARSCETVFAIRYDNTGGITEYGITNGFKIWSPGGGTFAPVYATLNENYQWDSTPESSGFFDMFNPSYFSCDGSGTDTVGIGGVASFWGTGLPADFNDVAVYIHTGDIPDASLICIDSSWYPPAGVWKWGTSGIKPTWNGPYCYTAITLPCIPPVFADGTPDTLLIYWNTTFNYQFQGKFFYEEPWDPIYFYFPDSIGTGNESTGEWSFDVTSDMDGTSFEMEVIVHNCHPCFGTSKIFTVVIDFSADPYSFDVNADNVSDISDLVDIIDYMFKDLPVPPQINLAEVDDEPGFDVGDVVYLIDYMFNEGPPPIR